MHCICLFIGLAFEKKLRYKTCIYHHREYSNATTAAKDCLSDANCYGVIWDCDGYGNAHLCELHANKIYDDDTPHSKCIYVRNGNIFYCVS